MRFVVSLVLFGSLFLQVLAAPAHNAHAGPSTAGGTSSGSTVPSHPGGSPPPVQQPVAVEYGNVYGAAVKDHRSGPPEHEPLVKEKTDGNYQERKRHKNAIKQPHPFIPTHKEGDYHVGFVVTHSPPKLPGNQMPEHHVAASAYGNFKDDTQRIDGKTVHRKSQLLTTPRYVAAWDLGKKTPTSPERLDEGKLEELKKNCTCSYVFHIYCCLTCFPGCKREIGGYVGRTTMMDRSSNFLIDYRCSGKSKKAENRKSSTTSKASQKRQDRKGFAGKSKPMMKVKGPAGGRGTSHSKGHK